MAVNIQSAEVALFAVDPGAAGAPIIINPGPIPNVETSFSFVMVY